jgi:hypothetical protein
VVSSLSGEYVILYSVCQTHSALLQAQKNMKSTRMYTFVLKRKKLSKTKEKWPRADCSMTAADSSSRIEEVIPVKLRLQQKTQSRQMKAIRLFHERTGLAQCQLYIQVAMPQC